MLFRSETTSCSHLAAGDLRDSPPLAAAPAAGGWGIAGSRRVHSVGSSWAPAGVVMEVVAWPVLCLQVVLVLSGGEAPWSSTAERRPLPRARGPAGSPCAGFPPLDLRAADPVDALGADGGEAGGAAVGGGWRLCGVRG